MNYFPFFMDIDGADALIVGGGRVALRKVQKLLPYTPHITVAAPEFDPELEKLTGISLVRCVYSPKLLNGRDFVVAATGDSSVNQRISKACREMRIPVNVVDDRAACSFLFPALVKSGDVSIGISTGGSSPSASIYLRQAIEELLPPGLDKIVSYLDSIRPQVKAALPTERQRAGTFRALFARCLELGRSLEEDELEEYLSGKRS